jgi:pyrrolidone-carboxylate peptidase
MKVAYMPVMRPGYIHVRVTEMAEGVNHYSNTLVMSVKAALRAVGVALQVGVQPPRLHGRLHG